MILIFQCTTTYVIDMFTLHAASGKFNSSIRFIMIDYVPATALAATSFLRSLAGFGFPLFAPAMYHVLGLGNGNTVLAVVGIGIGCPAYVLLDHSK
jgi:hypothetical protein